MTRLRVFLTGPVHVRGLTPVTRWLESTLRQFEVPLPVRDGGRDGGKLVYLDKLVKLVNRRIYNLSVLVTREPRRVRPKRSLYIQRLQQFGIKGQAIRKYTVPPQRLNLDAIAGLYGAATPFTPDTWRVAPNAVPAPPPDAIRGRGLMQIPWTDIEVEP